MPIIVHGNLKIFHNPARREALVAAHGQYYRGELFSPGTPKIKVPAGLTVYLYADKGKSGFGGQKINRVLMGTVYEVEIVNEGERILDYELSHMVRSRSTNPALQSLASDNWLLNHALFDYIGVRELRPGKGQGELNRTNKSDYKGPTVNLSDLFAAIAQLQLPYHTLHNMHCRVDQYHTG